MSELILEYYDQLKNSVINGKQEDAIALTNQLIQLNTKPQDVIDYALLKGMEVVGERFREQKIFVPHVLIAARAMKSAMSILNPLIADDKSNSKGTVLLGTVKGDVHDIGKNLVGVMIEGAGYKVVDIGTGKTAEDFYEEYKKVSPNVIGLSALLTSTMTYMKEVITFFRKRDSVVPIIVGGAPVTKKFAEEIGATAFGRNSYEAVKIVDELIGVS